MVNIAQVTKNNKKFFACSSVSCRERMLDCQKIVDYLSINGWSPAKNISKADTIIINTCSFSPEEDESSIDLIRHYLVRRKHSAQLIITGCVPAINPALLKVLGNFPYVIPTELESLDGIIGADTHFHDIKDPVYISAQSVSYRPILKKLLYLKRAVRWFISEFKLSWEFISKVARSWSSSLFYIRFLDKSINPFIVNNMNNFTYLRISKGCLGACSYCAKRFATGSVVSKPPEEIIDEFKTALKHGSKNFYIISEDSGCYGLDIAINIVELLHKIFEAGKNIDFKLSITNFNAQWFVKYFDQLRPLLLINQRKILYLQIPVQSGSNKVLKLMNRPYRIEEINRCLFKLREEAPGLALTTDIIVGFPGENDHDFKKTCSLLKSVNFDFADIFVYEDRPGTVASGMRNKVTPKDISDRKVFLLKTQNSNLSLSFFVKKGIMAIKEFL
ncbi:MAG: radical SAM protein [Candidatus Omnitrophota bacterium]|nr:radical SAM protein [Candidatus Omnitrophota bacterium]MBU1928373.1 radical SAM protein [Candidatus Omnitrophota bacterium]MBU2035175.1 radical SAM protein [Candidatus Omnitrophota bacterium]MBU2221742.1 radical SAM protein [Candidatus Omnitrophota bacterium]MBU2258539.1 radical SAM protein [Candidatus Omnitrophota bacterium]